MNTRRRQHKRRENLFGFGRRGKGKGQTISSSSRIEREAYEAGYRGEGGQRGTALFGKWLEKQPERGEFSRGFVGRLKKEYKRGVVEEHADHLLERQGLKGKAKKAAGEKAVTYKGYRIEPVGEGEWVVPKVDKESRFESLAEAKRFVASNPKRKRRGPVESTVTGITSTGSSVGRYLDRELGRIVGNPQDRYLLFSQTMYRTIGEKGGPQTVSGPTTRVAHGTKIEVMQKSGKRVLVKGYWDNAPFYGWIDESDAVTGKVYRSTHGAEPEGMRSNPTPTLTQGDSRAYVIELKSNLYSAWVVDGKGKKWEQEFSGERAEEVAKGWARLKLFEVAGASRNPKRRGKRNPESSAASMYETFHGRPSQETIALTETEHYHTHVATLGTCCGFLIDDGSRTFAIGLSGYTWNPRAKGPGKMRGGFEKTDENAEDVLLTSNEDGTQLFVDGGDQSLDLDGLDITGAEAEHESIILGQVALVGYETAKKFDDFETIQYVHEFSEDSHGPLPVLRYMRLNGKGARMFLDGGVYQVEKPLTGVSAGIVD